MPTFRRRLVGTAVLAMSCGLPVAAHAAVPDDTAQGFVRGVYGRYAAHGPGVATTRPGGSAVYSTALLDAFAKAQGSVPAGDIAPIDYDPLCTCQDYGDLKLEAVDVASDGTGRATAQVVFADAGTHKTVILSLVTTGVGWRIDDVGVPGHRTVAAVLRAAIAAKRR